MKMKMKSTLPFIGMVVGQIAQVGLTLAGKKAIATGMHNFSYVFYSNFLASFILLPTSFLIHRSPDRPPLTLSVASGFLVSSSGASDEGRNSASVFATTGILELKQMQKHKTFMRSVFLVVQSYIVIINVCYYISLIIGTLVSVLGAIIVTFYTGPAIITSHLTSIAPQHLLGQSSSDFILGGVLMLIDCVLAALFIIAQAVVLKKYSAVLILMLAYCSIILASILEHDLSAFSLQSKTRLLALLYAGCFGAGFQLTFGAWCVKMKGPLFVAMFHPLGIVIAAIMGVLFLGDGLYLGCLLGSGVIVIGFYGVMWGKGKEDKIVEEDMVESSKSPLAR